MSDWRRLAAKVIPIIKAGKTVPEEDTVKILTAIKPILLAERNCLTLTSPVIVCGDLHGQLEDVLKMFHVALKAESVDEDADPDEALQQLIRGCEVPFLFLGDYVDRGHHSVDTLLLLVLLKLLHPDKFWLLRGNHESRQVSQQYGFTNECFLKYGLFRFQIPMRSITKSRFSLNQSTGLNPANIEAKSIQI
jgi:hypothetical protein